MIELITILGPTATGKTKLAARLALEISGEIISADSRQVYKNLDIGTGKDLDDYHINGHHVPYHLIDIIDVSYEYNVFNFQQDFLKSFQQIKNKNNVPILCGGTGLYLESIIKGYNLVKTPENTELRAALENKSNDDLLQILISHKKLHNITDSEDRNRMIRAIEIAKYEAEHPEIKFPSINSINFGIMLERSEIKERITQRLKYRLANGMIEEVDFLLKSGIPAERLFLLGLEYRFITQYLRNELNYNDMYQKLNSAIHAFAKRQMTWFRKMEREGIQINWINGQLGINKIIEQIISLIKRH